DRDGMCFAVPGTLTKTGFGAQNTAQLMLTMHEENGAPFMCDPRQQLARQVELLAAEGLTACAAFELEFFLFKREAVDIEIIPEKSPVSSGPHVQNMYDLQELEEYSCVFKAITTAAKLQGIATDTIVSEAAPGQFEVNLIHRSNVLRAADEAVLLKRIIKGCAKDFGLNASFMAKPFNDRAGNGMHVHLSLLDRKGANVFSDDNGADKLRHAIAGTLKRMPECTLAFINTINGFRRLQPGSYAPTRAVWGENNRSVAVRVPASPDHAKRFEHRIAGADANPYMVMTAIIAAVREGLKDQLEPPAAIELNAYDGAAEQLPSRPHEALALFGTSVFAKEAFTPSGHKVFAALKRSEIDEFAAEITPLERLTYGR
ncbi:MAG: glutamine synthetase family protein, partial [Hyphomicrobiales bacterium]